MGILSSSAASMAGSFLDVVAGQGQSTVLIAFRLDQKWFKCAVWHGRYCSVPFVA